MEYVIKNRQGATVKMKNGSPFVYTTDWTARLGAKYLRGKTAKADRPLRVVPVS